MAREMVKTLAYPRDKKPMPDEYKDGLIDRLLEGNEVAWGHIDLPDPMVFDYWGGMMVSRVIAWANEITKNLG